MDTLYAATRKFNQTSKSSTTPQPAASKTGVMKASFSL